MYGPAITILQGELYWFERGKPRGPVISGRRPHVVIQNNALNQTGISTVIVVPITSSDERRGLPGNVSLSAGEGGLTEDSVANVSQTVVVGRVQLSRRPIGILPERRVREIIAGLNMLLTPRG